MTPDDIRDYQEILGALSRHEFLRPEEVYLYASHRAREAIEETATIADHHAEVHDTAAKCHAAIVPQDSNSEWLAYGHKGGSLCAAKIADDIRALKDSKDAAALEWVTAALRSKISTNTERGQ